MTAIRWRFFVTMLLAVLFGRFVGPLLGEWVTPADGGVLWQLLPWVLIALVWVVLFRYLRRVKRGT